MKRMSIFLLAVIVTIAIETGTANYLLVQVDHRTRDGKYTNLIIFKVHMKFHSIIQSYLLYYCIENNVKEIVQQRTRAADCSCTDYVDGYGFGNCQKIQGEGRPGQDGPGCYVNEPSNCPDNAWFQTTGKNYSWEACRNSFK